ncbi:adenylate kinase domain-containing protein [Ditylenchus destructor]|uniref:Adenylate kinase domain-containing protein n=1 Tax=Ditylenchus destructor TaxID=166010 RepID=A0AAD4MZS6_9BILA|nr:adenylate kinase domain-containing protein [Ditylenchus destructor]
MDSFGPAQSATVVDPTRSSAVHDTVGQPMEEVEDDNASDIALNARYFYTAAFALTEKNRSSTCKATVSACRREEDRRLESTEGRKHCRWTGKWEGHAIREDRREAGSTRGGQLKAMMEAGQLVPLTIVLNLIKEAMVKAVEDKGFLIDGYPREIQSSKLVFYFDVLNENTLIERLLKRAQTDGRNSGKLARIEAYGTVDAIFVELTIISDRNFEDTTSYGPPGIWCPHYDNELEATNHRNSRKRMDGNRARPRKMEKHRKWATSASETRYPSKWMIDHGEQKNIYCRKWGKASFDKIEKEHSPEETGVKLVSGYLQSDVKETIETEERRVKNTAYNFHVLTDREIKFLFPNLPKYACHYTTYAAEGRRYVPWMKQQLQKFNGVPKLPSGQIFKFLARI